MSRRHRTVLMASAFLLGALLLALTPAPVAVASSGSTTCRVRNVTQDTRGRSFNAMVRAAHDGDRLQVRGRCPAHAIIKVDLVIVGVGEARPVLTGQDRRGVLRVRPHTDVVLQHLVITAGREQHDPERFGAGIWNEGTLLVRDSVIRDNEDFGSGGTFDSGTMTLRDSVVRDNHAASIDGGGIANTGTMTVIDSVIASNEAYWDGYDVYPSGGGIYNAGTLILRRSIVRHNTASEHGGGIYNRGSLTLSLSRVSSNTSRVGGGVSNNWGATLTLRSSRVAGNAASGEGGGIWNDDDSVGGDGSVTLDTTTTVTGNTPDDCVGTPAC